MTIYMLIDKWIMLGQIQSPRQAEVGVFLLKIVQSLYLMKEILLFDDKLLVPHCTNGPVGFIERTEENQLAIESNGYKIVDSKSIILPTPQAEIPKGFAQIAKFHGVFSMN